MRLPATLFIYGAKFEVRLEWIQSTAIIKQAWEEKANSSISLTGKIMPVTVKPA